MGSNLGRSEDILRAAIHQLRGLLGHLEVASLYRTRPISPHPQPSFLNTAVLARTVLAPDAVLALAKALEMRAGRRAGLRFGPRPLDIDLLLYGDRVCATPELILPHPRLHHRRFALAPLADLAPELPVPPGGATVAQLLERVGQNGEVERLRWRHAPDAASAAAELAPTGRGRDL